LEVAGTYAPPFRPLTDNEARDTAALINAAHPHIVWVGLGTPKQDEWVGRFRPLLDAPVLIAVGAAFDFHAGTVRQAPRWMMSMGLEWFFRLLREPRRLWRRYLVGNPRFVALVLRQWWKERPVKRQ
jgi:N-acetylglucosaminyldiphosphoundecaprenol N-acetyl-beta-D-mannosaminyltransferase